MIALQIFPDGKFAAVDRPHRLDRSLSGRLPRSAHPFCLPSRIAPIACPRDAAGLLTDMAVTMAKNVSKPAIHGGVMVQDAADEPTSCARVCVLKSAIFGYLVAPACPGSSAKHGMPILSLTVDQLECGTVLILLVFLFGCLSLSRLYPYR